MTLPTQISEPAISLQSSTGRCSSRLARKHEQCDPYNCECEQGMSSSLVIIHKVHVY